MERYLSMKIISLFLIVTLFIQLAKAEVESLLSVNIEVEPKLLYPGNDGYIKLILKNVGNAKIESIKISSISFDAPIKVFTFPSELGSLNIGDSLSYYIKFSVNKDSSPGIYIFQLSIDYCKDFICKTIYPNTIINILSPQALEVSKIYPSSLKVGERANLTFEISNKMSESVANIIFTWSLPINYSYVIIPSGMSNRIFIQEIPSKSTYKLSIPILVNPSSQTGTFPIIVNLQYTDKNGNNQLITSSVGMEITSETDFDIVLQDITSNSLSLIVINVGNSEAYSVVVKLLPNNLISVINSVSSVLGNLAPGDYSTANFNIRFREKNFTNSRANNSLVVEISYTDSSGIRRTVVKNLDNINLNTFSTQQIENLQIRNRNINNFGSSYIIIGILGLVILILAFRFILKKGKKR